MCGRYALHTLPVEVVKSLGLFSAPRFEPRYNIAPTTNSPVVMVDEQGRREAVPMRWGLIPSWAKDASIGNRMINARSETVAEKPAYRRALRDRRCLVPANGFYEWKKQGSRKQPYFIHRPDGRPLLLAGLWERWVDRSSGEEIRSFTIITRSANDLVRAVHDRMPVLLDDPAADAWLDHESQLSSQPDRLERLMQGDHDVPLVMYAVDTAVNRPANDDASLIEPAADQMPTAD